MKVTWSRAVVVNREEVNRLDRIKKSRDKVGWWTEWWWQRKEESRTFTNHPALQVV